MPSAADLAARPAQSRQKIAAIEDLCPDSLVANYRRCGKPTCRCTAQHHPRHGPCWLLTCLVRGQVRTIRIPESQLPRTSARFADCQRLRRLVATLKGDQRRPVPVPRVRSRQRSKAHKNLMNGFPAHAEAWDRLQSERRTGGRRP